MTDLADALIASGWLAVKADALDSLDALPAGADLLPLLADASQERTARVSCPNTTKNKSGTETHPSLARLLTSSMQRGAKLTLGWPGCEARPLDQWIGPRLMWWPRGVPEGRKIAWVSSRLGRAIDERPDWFAVLRSATAKLDPARDVLLTTPSTTVDRFLERAAILFGLRRLRVQLEERSSLVDWLTRLRRQIRRSGLANDSDTGDVESCSEANFLQSHVLVSPSLPLFPRLTHFPSPNRDKTEKPQRSVDRISLCDLPSQDRLLIGAADQVLALQIRQGGNLHQILRARLHDASWPTASVWLALGESLVPAEVAAELQSLGAVGWWLLASNDTSVQKQDSASRTDGADTNSERNSLSQLPWLEGEYFVHWTRRRDGPWPQQSKEDFLDDLLWSRESSNHSAFAALSRIVQERRLIASSLGIRGGTSIVSFSANSLIDVVKQRTFRPHRGRWDGESYGLCIRRDWLEARGAKPVIYGDDTSWPALTESDRPFFQLRTTRSRRAAKVIDWSQEAEWRVPQDVDLSEAVREDLLLFVPSEDEARQLAAISPWPVLILPSSPLATSGRGAGGKGQSR